jgi:predicted metalloprotease with PDZ domain
MRFPASILAFCCAAAAARAQPVVHYTLRVDSADLAAYRVEMRLQGTPDTLRLAMARHPEYDDKFWRYVDDLTVSSPRGPATITRVDSAVWRVRGPGGQLVVRYRIRLPAAAPGPRAAWRPFLAPTGGLVGGPHSFMYVVGATDGWSRVQLELPRSWSIATGLTSTSDPHTFVAANTHALVESPILIGTFKDWRFVVDGVPHRVAYWPLPNATPFDTAAYVDALHRLVREALAMARAPYREYTFLVQDGAFGALEHPNSVTLGVPSANLALGIAPQMGETAHEFFHTWNLMDLRPVEYKGVDYRDPEPSPSLWFSEGLTLFYADLLVRRAGIPRPDSTRAAHVGTLMSRYLAYSGNSHLSAEAVSRVAYNAPRGSLGDYDASTHLQGELIGAMLDLVIRDATNGRWSMDDVMNAMYKRYAGDRGGFTGRDVERAVNDVCGCSVTAFFDAHVRGGGTPIDFNRYLRLIGLRADVSWVPAERNGQPLPDARMGAWDPPGEGHPRLSVWDPATVWARAGLHSRDVLVLLNGAPVADGNAFRQFINRVRVGDTVRVEVSRPTGPFSATVVLPGYTRPVVRLVELPDMTAKQRTLLNQWRDTKPSRAEDAAQRIGALSRPGGG